MRLKSVVNAAAYGISASILAFGIAANANAQQFDVASGCHTKAVVEAAIAKGGFKPIALGNRVDGVGNANIYFANSQGYGFAAEGDRPLGTPVDKQICVAEHFKEVRVNDPRNSQIPTWLTLKSGNGKDYTNFEAGYKNGSRIVFTAVAYNKQADGSEKLGKTIAIYAGTDKTATIEGIDYRGYSQAVTLLKNFALTSNANEFVVATAQPTDVTLAQGPKMAPQR